MTTGELLADQIRRTREWTMRLAGDLEGEDWTYQARSGLQHALWICGHLVVAQDLLVFQRCLDDTQIDPEFSAHFVIGGPVKSAEEYNWPIPTLVRQKMEGMQKVTE